MLRLSRPPPAPPSSMLKPQASYRAGFVSHEACQAESTLKRGGGRGRGVTLESKKVSDFVLQIPDLTRCRTWDLGLQIPDFGFWLLGPTSSRFSHLGFRVLDFVFWIRQDFAFGILPDFGFQILDPARFRISDRGCQILPDFGFRILDHSGFRISDVGSGAMAMQLEQGRGGWQIKSDGLGSMCLGFPRH